MDPMLSRRALLKLAGAARVGARAGLALAQPQDRPKKGGTLTLGRNHDADTLYPGKSTGLSAIATNLLLLYDGLVLHDFSMKIRPALAIPTPNTVRWRDDKTDPLFKITQTTLKESERIKAFQGIEQRLVGEAVVVPIQHIRWIFGSRPRVQGMKYHPIHGVCTLMDTWVS